MEWNTEGILAVLLISLLYNQFIFRSAALHIFEIGKSRTFLKKEKARIPLKQKILLIGYVERCKYYVPTARRLMYAYWLGDGMVLLCLLCWMASRFWGAANLVLPYVMSAKVILFDIPTLVFLFVMTKHGKNGGVVWRWEK